MDIDSRPDLTVILVNYNTGHLFDRLFSSLKDASGGLLIQTILVDNASKDDSVATLRSNYPTVELIENQVNVGFGRANNQALPLVRGRYVLLLNTDAFVAPNTLRKTLNFMQTHPRCGVLGVKLVGEDGSLQPSCRYFPTPWNTFLSTTGLQRFFPRSKLMDDMSWDHATVRNCDWVPGCFYLLRHEVIERVGLFDPRFFLYFEEVDHSRAVKNDGWDVTYYPFTQVVHIGGESAKSRGSLTSAGRQVSAIQIESELLYFRKHYGLVGLATSVILTTCADLFSASKAIFRPRNKAKGAAARQHLRRVFRVLAETRMGSRPTR
jgi:N-acetylglucosaminyl-diphospho-decaprenol L-rhamnosyltransferase